MIYLHRPFSFDILLAAMNCRIAQARMYSGTSSAHINITTLSPKKQDNWWARLRQKLMSLIVSTGSGRFGWIATQVQRKMVVIQLHIIPGRVLQLLMSLHESSVLAS